MRLFFLEYNEQSGLLLLCVRPRVFAWHKQFTSGHERVKNESHNCRPQTSITTQNIDANHKLLEGDRCLMVSKISSVVGISYGSAQSIITAELGFCNVCARWVSRLLTEEQKLVRLQVCERLSTQFWGTHFLITLLPAMKHGSTTKCLNQSKPVWSGERRAKQLP